MGSIVASDALELLPNVRVRGDVEYRQSEVQLGAIVEGRLMRQAGTGTAKLKLASSG
jgi:cytoskeletal protein CcmA (bactofilin family)